MATDPELRAYNKGRRDEQKATQLWIEHLWKLGKINYATAQEIIDALAQIDRRPTK